MGTIGGGVVQQNLKMTKFEGFIDAISKPIYHNSSASHHIKFSIFKGMLSKRPVCHQMLNPVYTRLTESLFEARRRKNVFLIKDNRYNVSSLCYTSYRDEHRKAG